MDRDHLYITLFSNASQHIYPDKIAAFTIQLARPIRLDPSEIWEVGLHELSYSATQQLANMAGDNTNAPQLIGTAMVRNLRTFKIVPVAYDREYLFQNVYYVPVEEKTFRDIRIEILNLSGEWIAFKDSKTPLKVGLHFRRVITH